MVFEEVYCITLAGSKERRASVKEELKDWNPKIWYTCIKPLDGSNINTLYTPYYDNIKITSPKVYNRVLDCAINHYTIIKTAYLRGVENILIFEDDIKLLPTFSKAVKETPTNTDVVKYWCTSYENKPVWDGKQPLYNKEPSLLETCSTLCYGLSRKGMKAYIELQDNGLQPADMPFVNLLKDKNLNCITLNYKVCKPKGFKSQINGNC